MPYVHIRITDEGTTPSQKAELIARTTRALVDVLGKNPATTFVTIEEIPTDNWGIAGDTATERRKRSD